MNEIFDLTAMLHPDLYKRQAQMAQLRGGGQPLAGPSGLPFVEPTGAPQAAAPAPTPQPTPPMQPAPPTAAGGGLPRAVGRASPPPVQAPAPATPFGGTAMGYMDKADEARRVAMEAMTPKPEELAAARKNALAQTVAGMGMALSGEEFAPMGQAMFQAAQKEFADISPNPWKRAELASKKAEMEATAWEKRAAMATSTEERRFALAQAQQQREADREMKLMIAGLAAGGRSDRKNEAHDQRLFQRAVALRNDFDPMVKNERISLQTYPQIEAALTGTPSPASDMRAIFRYMKMLDPTSVVREGEYATAANAAAVPDRVRNAYNNVMKGHKLTPQQRVDFLAQARSERDTAQRQFDTQAARFAEIARRAGVDPQDVVPGWSGLDTPRGEGAGGAPQRPRFERRGQGAQPGADGVNQLPY